MQPGMPQGAGRIGGTPIITLPGNPVSALVSFEVFIRPPLRAAMGLPEPQRPRRTAVLTEDLTSPRGKRQFRRGVLDADRGTVTSYGPPASHHLRWLASANCLLEIDEDVTELAAGSRVQVWDLSERVATRRIAARWPDAPTSRSGPARLVALVRSSIPPMHPAGLPFVGASLAVAAAGRTQPLAAPRRPGRRRAPTPRSSATRRGCHPPAPVSSSHPPTG